MSLSRVICHLHGAVDVYVGRRFREVLPLLFGCNKPHVLFIYQRYPTAVYQFHHSKKCIRLPCWFCLAYPSVFFTLWCLCVFLFLLMDDLGSEWPISGFQISWWNGHHPSHILCLVAYPISHAHSIFSPFGFVWKCGIPHRLVVLMVNLMLFNWNWGHGFTSCIFSHMFSTFSPYPLVIKHSYGSWIYGWFSWGSTMKNNDFDHVGGSWNRGTPKSSKSLDHFSIETSGDLGIPHDFGNLHIYIFIHSFIYYIYIYIVFYITYVPIVFLNFPPHVFPISPISCHHITWMARSPGAAQGDPRAHQGRVFRRLQRVAVQQSGGPGDGDGDLLWLFLRETIMSFIYLFIYLFI